MNENIPLSTAIRLGAMLRPQARGWILDPQGANTCAWGAALEAVGVSIKKAQSQRWGTPLNWRAMARRRVKCPARYSECAFCYPSANHECIDCAKSQALSVMIEHLNDDHRWTREQIADQVEIWERESIEQLSPVVREEQEACL